MSEEETVVETRWVITRVPCEEGEVLPPPKKLSGHLTIPYPRPIAYGWGLDSTRGPNGCFIQCRGTRMEQDKIKRAADILNISYNSFLRSVANAAADEILLIAKKMDPTIQAYDAMNGTQREATDDLDRTDPS